MLAAAELEREGISCEVINLRTLKPLDRDTIIQSLKKTHRVVTVEEGWGQCGIGAEICSIINESIFNVISKLMLSSIWMHLLLELQAQIFQHLMHLI